MICTNCHIPIDPQDAFCDHDGPKPYCEACFERLVDGQCDKVTRGATRLLADVMKEQTSLVGSIAQGMAAFARAKPHYGMLLLYNITKGLKLETLHATADGDRCVVLFSPRDAGEEHETYNEPQRYELLVRLLHEAEGAAADITGSEQPETEKES